MREEIKSKVNNNSMVMKRIKEKDNGLIQKYRLELKKAYSFEELVVVCSQVVVLLCSCADMPTLGCVMNARRVRMRSN